jgi:cobalamin biosynthesis Mg chelatase CobN
LTAAVTSRQFDLLYDATCGDERVRDFLLQANPEAARAIASRFVEAARRGFWVSRRNSSAQDLAEMMEARASSSTTAPVSADESNLQQETEPRRRAAKKGAGP